MEMEMESYKVEAKKRWDGSYHIPHILLVASPQDCTGTRKEEMMNDFAPKASRNGKLVLQKILANKVSLVGNQSCFIIRGDACLFWSVWSLHY